jgi:3-deoxy-D-manno-octulosonic acid kinase
MTARTLPAGRATILYDDALLSHADESRFSPSGRAAVGGRGAAWIVPGEDGEWVLRHYRRGGLAAKLSTDLYLWTGLELTRPWLEWHLLAELHTLGLPVPRPVAARVVRAGLGYRGDLLTRRIPAARTLAELLQTRAKLPWHDVGVTLRRFHDASVWHADLNAHNVLVDEGGGVWLLDFDRSERRLHGPWKRANLERLQRSLRKLGLEDPAGWSELLAGYSG